MDTGTPIMPMMCRACVVLGKRSADKEQWLAWCRERGVQIKRISTGKKKCRERGMQGKRSGSCGAEKMECRERAVARAVLRKRRAGKEEWLM
eukprot:1158266-Pelagomonas_calceolata.AAC.5